MSRISISLGILLIVVGGVAYAVTEFASWTALIPAFIGVVFGGCGLLGHIKPMLGTMVGIVVAILGLAGTSMNVIQLGALFTGDAERPAAVITSTITFVLLIIYAVIAIRSLVTTRRDALKASDTGH